MAETLGKIVARKFMAWSERVTNDEERRLDDPEMYLAALIDRESAGRAAWTKEPKEGGWYWYRKPYGNPLLCYLQPATSRRFQFIAHGSGAAVYDVMPEGAEFLGPLRHLASGEERDEERARKAAEACAKWFAEGCVPANARGFESGLADEFYRRILAALSGEEGRRG